MDGLLLIAIAGFLLVIFLLHMMMREKQSLHEHGFDAQNTTLDHNLPGNPFRGFELLLKSAYMMGQAAFMLLMTWIRSEERRVGKECRSGWSPYHEKRRIIK